MATGLASGKRGRARQAGRDGMGACRASARSEESEEMKEFALGIDVGGSHITLDLVDLATMEIFSEATVRKSLNTHLSAGKVLSVFDEAIREIAGKVPSGSILSVGLGIPGPFDYPEGICRITPNQEKYEQLFGVNFRLALRHALGPDRPVIFLNDAASFALGEYFKGGAKGFHRAVVITLGTGFGASFLREGIPQTEGADVPPDGELWHIPYKTGIADDFFSTRRLTGDWERVTGEKLPGAKEIAQAALAGDARAVEIFRQFGKDLAEFVSPWLEKFQADAFVIGGNLARDLNLFVADFKEELAKRWPAQQVTVSPCLLGEQAPIYGAALSRTLLAPPPIPAYARMPRVEEVVRQMEGARVVRLDGPEKFPWKSLVSEVDLALRARGNGAIWVEAASAKTPAEREQFSLSEETPLSIVYGPGAREVWPAAEATNVML